MLGVAEGLTVEDFVGDEDEDEDEDVVVEVLVVVIPGCKDVVVEVVVVEVVVVVTPGCEDEELGVGSGVDSPITQYDLPASRLGQVTPGLILVNSSTEIPQPRARLSQVSPLPAGTSK